MAILYHSTNNPDEQVGFRDAILNGMASRYGLYMMDRDDLPHITPDDIENMSSMTYAAIAHRVLTPFVTPSIAESDFIDLLEDAYDPNQIPVELEHVTGKSSVLWLSRGPTYSFKDFAARFLGRVLDYFLGKDNIRRTVVVATSGDTGGAVAHALLGLENVSNIVFFPAGSISEEQRRQMTTLNQNIHAFAVNGDFDVCQEIAKHLLGDRSFAKECYGDPDRFTSANSISLGRLLPQAVYPFFAYSRMDAGKKPITVSIPSGNFGDMMGTVVAKAMGLPIDKIVIGVNENREFPQFMRAGRYEIKPSVWSPSTAMIVSHPSNLARLIEFYGGHMYDRRDEKTNTVVQPGVIDRMPDMERIRNDIYTVSVSNREHYETIRDVYEKYGVILDPHGAVGWKALEHYNGKKHDIPAVVYETADPGKFPEDIRKAIDINPKTPPGITRQSGLPERVYELETPSAVDDSGSKHMDPVQYNEVKEVIREIFT